MTAWRVAQQFATDGSSAGNVRRLRSGLVNAALAGSSAYLMCLVLELILTVSSTPLSTLDAARSAGVKVDARSKAEVLLDAHRRGEDLLPFSSARLMVQAGAFEPDGLLPVGGHSHVRTLMCNESGEWVTYRSDKHGFNNADSDWQAPEVVLVGDSFAHGACVSAEQSVAGQLRKVGIRTLNLGMGGLGPLGELAAIREYLPERGVRSVFWLYFEGNDIDDLVGEWTIPTLRRYAEDPTFKQRLLDRQEEIDRLWRQAFDAHLNSYLQAEREPKSFPFLAVLKLSRIRLRLGAVRKRAVDPRHECPERVMANLEHVVGMASRETRRAGAEFVGMYLPTFGRYLRNPGQRTDYCRPQVLAVFEKVGVPVIDLHQAVFARHPDPRTFFPYRTGGHYGPEGHRAIAREIQTFWGAR